jgi:hypothetical protein
MVGDECRYELTSRGTLGFFFTSLSSGDDLVTTRRETDGYDPLPDPLFLIL